nr:probable serine/threonine-protein kinase PIX7 [Tanacetum cinerariifolium]
MIVKWQQETLPRSLLGEGGFRCVFKGWIKDNEIALVKPGTRLIVAVKMLNHDGLQGGSDAPHSCFTTPSKGPPTALS